eukprot:scaffold3797_cov24-Attheya_sp.AAC.1
MTTATETSIGKVSTAEAALVPGNVVALHNHQTNCFLRISGTGANFGSGNREIGELPLYWDLERFLVVDAGNDKISLFSPCHRCFLGCQNGVLTANGYPIVSPDDRPRAHEIFQEKKEQLILRARASFESCRSKDFLQKRLQGSGAYQ